MSALPTSIPTNLRIGSRDYTVLRHVPATDGKHGYLEIRGRDWPAGSSPTVYPWPPQRHVLDRTEGGVAYLVSKVSPE